MLSLPPSEVIIAGLLLGGIYALAAFGLSLIFGVTKVLNIAHGEFIMLGGLATYLLFLKLGLNLLATFIILSIVALLVGFGFERALIRRILGKSPHEFLIGSLLVTLGIALAIEDLTAFLQMAFRMPYLLSVTVHLPIPYIGIVGLSPIRFASLILIVALTATLSIFLKKSRVGMAIRAFVQDREGALLTGLDVSRLSMITFGIGTFLAVIAGAIYILIFTVEPTLGLPLVLRLLCIVVLGGLGSLVGSLVGGLIIGLAETITAFYAGASWSPVTSMLIFILILLVRPRGLFGYAEA